MTLFSLLVGLGATLGLWQVARMAPLNQTGRWVDAGLGVLAGMLIGARAGYVVLRPAYYAAHPGEWLQLWMGGYSAWGAVAGGLFAAGIAALALRKPLPTALDGLAPLFPPLAVLGWLGCLASGCAYGPAITGGTWLALPVVDEWGQVLPRFPLQIAAALALVGYNWGVAAALVPRRSVKQSPLRAGQQAGLVGLGLAVVQFFGALLTVEPLPMWNGLSYEAWAALALGGLSLILVGYAFMPIRKRNHSPAKPLSERGKRGAKREDAETQR